MKIIHGMLLACLALASCEKEAEAPVLSQSVVSLPFEDASLKLEVVTTSLPDWVTDIHFADASVGLAITYTGSIYRTTDSGKKWTLQHSNATADQPLQRLEFTSLLVGYAVGGSRACSGANCTPAGGLILKTVDGGATWASVYQAARVEIVAIAANSRGELFAISKGPNTQLLKSSNAGTTWAPVAEFAFPLAEIAFDNTFGYCAGANGKIIGSLDNGTTWNALPTLTSNYFNDLKFLTSSGYCISNNSLVYKTTDNGQNWVELPQAGVSAFVVNPLTATSVLVFGAGRYSGGDFGTYDGAVMQTTNGGAGWHQLELRNIGAVRYTSFYSATRGYAAAGRALVQVTVK
ncbi:hypothetical protein I2I05_19360 [Hymenobacter sp. BT683]|uniref:Photosynthesis system II assembly factor Ycf48/Hcf136-like domain-containing protein n=1 Tax=Hymenobacter jeongseonensis TaxID=2791027 RepID=A0ABS0IMG9_9BACT|nr:YCF48-related protein [Hymenobacter jeongseonensis]MBF9239559.1 hypothetical protein [Hymenobacter jeongseonensis]